MTTDIDTPSRQQQLAAGSIGSDVSFLMARANAVSLSTANTRLAGHGLRVRSYSVLALACDDGRPSQKEIAELLRLDPSQVVSLIDDLQDRGYVERVPDPRDRRSNVLTATPKGREAHARARVDARRAEEDLLAPLTVAERETLSRVLRQLAFPSA
ncbi:MarR family winged helix-turn-helix transcriptional regulator [Microbacterium sp. A93]|uniref:MarR family winged helix-turn-helix transcriptional regulator n=1 Tax=Microbacterium sp. A93 TaxID=3450716 RepID=UPI003F41B64D